MRFKMKKKIHEMKVSKSYKKPLSKEQKRSTWAFFTILFPSLILTMILTFPRTTESIVIGILLFFYQAVLLKKFTEDYYNIAA